ncbi:MAG: Lrp/AsnC family transcriptional regulator [Candidatus Bathyarchaeota archaeon]|nr:Lrp/AsnC family transcriptional regulator [Candidatus Bathyarchaeum sp.]
MGAIVEIDEIDKKILHILLKDARSRLKDIAKECGICSVSALNRIKRLKKLGVIKKGTIFTNMKQTLNAVVVAIIGIELDWDQKHDISKLLHEETDLIELSSCIGKYDLCALVQTRSLSELEKLTCKVKKKFGARKVTSLIWSNAHLDFGNVDLQPLDSDENG